MQQTIYKKDSKGNIRFLTISTEGSTLFQESGIVGTDNPILHSKVCKAKNIGKGNETTPEEQSVLEAVAIVKDKLTKGYSLSIEETNTVDIILPQLAKDYFKEKHKINFSKDVVLVQPKLDGCLVAGSMIKTDKGLIRIAEIVDKQLDVKVLSYNEMTKENEYKRVVNWFNNGSTSTTNFRELVFEDGSKLKCTLNHKFLTETGWKELRNIDVFSEKVMKLNMNVKQAETPSNLDTQGFTAIKNIRGVTGVKLVKYDIEVEGNHNYYAEDILVHNCRALAFVKSTGEVELISRTGKKIENMMHIEKELSNLGIDIILDGELYVHGESFQTNMSYIKKYYPVKSERILFNVYDVVDKDNPYLERTEILKTLNLKSVQRLPYFRVFNEEEITEFYRQFIREGYEGLMVKVSNLGYKSNARISELLKYKQFIDIQLPILDVIPADQRPDWGTPIYYWEGAKDNILKSGTKMTHEQRKDLLENKQEYVGKYAEIRFFEYSDEGVPRFPVTVGIRLDK